MKIAVAYESGQVFQHFGRTQTFKLYNIESGKILCSKVISTNGQGHGLLATLLHNNQIDTLICGGIGSGAQTALAELGIKLYAGVQGNADDAIEALLAGKLEYNPDAHCAHHDHEHSNGAHVCGNHGCHQ